MITRGEATRLINKEDAVVVDLRQRDDFRKGHIAGATNLLPSEIKANNVGELKSTKTSRLSWSTVQVCSAVNPLTR